MPIDPNIAMGFKGIELQSPLVQYGQLAQIQNAQNQNAMAQLQMREAETAAQEKNMLRRLDPTATDYESQLFRVDPKLGIQYRREQSAADASKAAAAASLASAAKSKQEILGQALRDISGRPSDANITAHTEDIQASPLFSAEEKAKALITQQTLLGIPFEQRQAYLQSQGAKPSDLKPTLTPQDFGGGKRIVTTPAFGGATTVVPGSEITKTMTPFEAGRLPILQQQANISAGQLKVAQDRLLAESATGVLSPESLELAANLYAQTGTLPQLGIGKGAANVKSQIMNRAAQLTMGDGTSAADAAANLASAKQDTGSRTQAVKAFATGKQGQQVTAFNTAIDHLSTMTKLSDALQNNDLKAFNLLGNTVARQTGQPAPTNFDAAKQIVTAEIIKAVVASGGGVKERQEAENNFAAASSPEQLKGVINTYKQLLGGQLNSLNLQYENSTGRKDFDKKLTPDAKAELNKLRGVEKPATGSGALSAAEQAELDQLRQRFGK
jgi:hypothetical protein